MYDTSACQDKSELITTPKSLKLDTLSIISPLAVKLGTEFLSIFVPKCMSISLVFFSLICMPFFIDHVHARSVADCNEQSVVSVEINDIVMSSTYLAWDKAFTTLTGRSFHASIRLQANENWRDAFYVIIFSINQFSVKKLLLESSRSSQCPANVEMRRPERVLSFKQNRKVTCWCDGIVHCIGKVI